MEFLVTMTTSVPGGTYFPPPANGAAGAEFLVAFTPAAPGSRPAADADQPVTS